MRALIMLLVLMVAGCQHFTDLQTQRRKEADRHSILSGQPTRWYSEHDAGIWDNSPHEPAPSVQRVLAHSRW